MLLIIVSDSKANRWKTRRLWYTKVSKKRSIWKMKSYTNKMKNWTKYTWSTMEKWSWSNKWYSKMIRNLSTGWSKSLNIKNVSFHWSIVSSSSTRRSYFSRKLISLLKLSARNVQFTISTRKYCLRYSTMNVMTFYKTLLISSLTKTNSIRV